MKRNIGMYVHMHWGYNHPYCARTWTIDDWRGYATGLAALGYNLVMIWPMLEIIPDPPTQSDITHLEKMRQVIDMLKSEFGMTVLIVMGANVVGNERAADFAFESRPYFKCDLRLNPGDEKDVERLMRFRSSLYNYLGKADGCVIIDSDPGGYIGSTNDEFSNLLWRHLDMVREYNPSAQLYYWMWMGWEAYNTMWKEVQEGLPARFDTRVSDFEPVLGNLMECPDEPWRLLRCRPIHWEIVEQLGLQDRAIFFPYALVEAEPTFPRTNCDPAAISKGIESYLPDKTPLGSMANSQTHAVQQPGAYLFAHFAKGGTLDDVDLAGFADGLVPGSGSLIAEAWNALNSTDSSGMRDIAHRVRERTKSAHRTGPYSGLLLQSPERFLEDLAMQLEWHADMREFASAVEQGADWHKPLKSLIGSWEKWFARTGFTETHCAPDTIFIHEALRGLHDPGIDPVLDDLENWREPAKRHGLVIRLLDAMRRLNKEM